MWNRAATFLSAMAMVVALLPETALAEPFADTAFQKLWARTDSLVASQLVDRTWYWGPQPFWSGQEDYQESPGGKRLVQYFDKARMEITNPGGDRNSPWYVTTGLLVRDMVAGTIQVGNSAVITRTSAQIAIAGDPLRDNPGAPTYATFRDLANLDGSKRATPRIGQPVTAVVRPDGSIGDNPSLGSDPGARVAYYDENLGHNIPQAFWSFMNQIGLVLEDGMYRNALLIDWVFTMGYPLTEPYWARVRVGGIEKDVLIQLYQRRVLTYTPSNPPGWQVEMGNVGQHYYQWRYGQSQSATLSVTPSSGRPGDEFHFVGTGFTPWEGVGFWATAPDGTVYGAPRQTLADAAGKVYIFLAAPLGIPAGKWYMTAKGTASGVTAIVAFQVQLELAPLAVGISFEPGEATPGSSVHVTGSNLGASEAVSLTLTAPSGSTSALTPVTTTASGTFSTTIVLTPTAPTGRWYLTAVGQATGRTGVGYFDVKQP
jgi:hypothetical protein